jgi:hypothetical protein
MYLFMAADKHCTKPKTLMKESGYVLVGRSIIRNDAITNSNTSSTLLMTEPATWFGTPNARGNMPTTQLFSRHLHYS